MSIKKKGVWRGVWLAQNGQCDSCGKAVELKDTAKSSYSFRIVCRNCYNKPNIIINRN